jgi:microcystin-dependent protein
LSEPQIGLSERDRALAQRLANNPLDMFQGQSLSWLEDFIRLTVGNSSTATGLAVGFQAVVQQDLTAETGEYVYTDSNGTQWLYCNGAAVSQTTYSDLYAFYGANAFGTDSGGNFFLPDCRGRSMFMCGTHTDADLGDNDGVAVANRTAKHTHTNGTTITGAPGVGTLALSPNPHSHSLTNPANAAIAAAGADRTISDLTSTTTGTTSLSITGAPSAGTLAVGGTIGTGTPVDTPAHLFVGSLLVRF